MSDRCGYNVIHAWVNANGDRLPATLAELSRFPMAYRRVIFGAVPAATRLSLWQEHIASFLGPASPLTGEQQVFVSELHVALPALLGDVPDKVALEALTRRGRALLGHDLALQIMATLGPPEPPEGLPVPSTEGLS